MKSAVESDQCPRFKLAQIQRVVIQCLFCVWVSGQQYLESAIQLEAIQFIRSNSTPNFVGCLQNQAIESRFGEQSRPMQTGQAGSHKNNIKLSKLRKLRSMKLLPLRPTVGMLLIKGGSVRQERSLPEWCSIRRNRKHLRPFPN